MGSKKADGIDVPFEFFGERQAFSHQPGGPLTQGAKEPLNVISVFFLLRGAVLLGRDNAFVGFPIIGVKGGPLAIGLGHGLPQTNCSAGPTLAHVQGHDLAAGAVQGHPQPLLVGLAAHKTP